MLNPRQAVRSRIRYRKDSWRLDALQIFRDRKPATGDRVKPSDGDDDVHRSVRKASRSNVETERRGKENREPLKLEAVGTR